MSVIMRVPSLGLVTLQGSLNLKTKGKTTPLDYQATPLEVADAIAALLPLGKLLA